MWKKSKKQLHQRVRKAIQAQDAWHIYQQTSRSTGSSSNTWSTPTSGSAAWKNATVSSTNIASNAISADKIAWDTPVAFDVLVAMVERLDDIANVQALEQVLEAKKAALADQLTVCPGCEKQAEIPENDYVCLNCRGLS